MTQRLNRRRFLQYTGLAGGGLMLGIELQETVAATGTAGAQAAFAPDRTGNCRLRHDRSRRPRDGVSVRRQRQLQPS